MRDSSETDEVLVCMAQRLQGQVERQLTLVDRLYATGAEDTLPDLAEMRATLRRSLRGVENLLVLGGAQQGPRGRGPRTVADLLADARAGVDDTARIDLRPAPDAGVASRAVTGLLALFTELFTHALTVSPGGGPVEVTGRRAEDGGVLVEVAVDGAGATAAELDELDRRLADRPIIDDIVSNRVGLFVAARMAARSGAGLRVRPRRHGGHVAVVHCPPGLLDPAPLDAVGAGPARSWLPALGGYDGGNGNGNGNGNGHHGNGNGNGRARSAGYPADEHAYGDPYADPYADPYTAGGVEGTGPHPRTGDPAPPPELRLGDLLQDPLRDPLRRPDPLVDPLPLLPPVSREPSPWDAAPLEPEVRPLPGPPAPVADRYPPDSYPPDSYPPADDALFGPLTRAQRDSMLDIGPTPIYEAVASAWFADDDEAGSAVPEWDAPGDAEWRAATERAARPVPEQEASTAAGLPRRRPGTQMVAPPRRGVAPPPNGSQEREADKVRERLAVYQQGLQRGRHRAGDEEAFDFGP